MGSSSLVRHARWLRAVGVFVAACSLCGPAFSAPTADAATAAPHIAAGRHHSPVTAGNHRYQSAEQASAEAIRTHKAVPVTSATTPTSTVTANPDGSFTLRESATPVRTRVDGAWKALNPRLIRNINGTWSPKVSSYPLTLSGGGIGPLATMTYG